MSYLPSHPDLCNLTGLIDLYPRRGILLFQLMAGIKDSLSSHDRRLYELLTHYISGLNKTEAGDAALTGFAGETTSEDQKLKPMLRFIKKLTLTPEHIAETDIIAIFEAGWDERTLLDSICLCALVNCMSRMASGIGINNQPGIN